MSSRFCGDKLHNFCFNATFSALLRISRQDDEVDGDDGEGVGDDGDDGVGDDDDDDASHVESVRPLCRPKKLRQ